MEGQCTGRVQMCECVSVWVCECVGVGVGVKNNSVACVSILSLFRWLLERALWCVPRANEAAIEADASVTNAHSRGVHVSL